MQINVAEPWQINHPRRDDAAVADYDDRFWCNALQLRAEFLVVLDLLRLDDGKPKRERGLFHRRLRQLHAASARAIRLGRDQPHAEAGTHQLFQRGHREAWRSAEDQVHHSEQLAISS